MRYRKKPVIIEAWQIPVNWTAQEPLPEWIHLSEDVFMDADRMTLVIHTLEGDMQAYPGNWIIRGVAGELYPCRDDIFRASYEPVEG